MYIYVYIYIYMYIYLHTWRGVEQATQRQPARRGCVRGAKIRPRVAPPEG